MTNKQQERNISSQSHKMYISLQVYSFVASIARISRIVIIRVIISIVVTIAIIKAGMITGVVVTIRTVVTTSIITITSSCSCY